MKAASEASTRILPLTGRRIGLLTASASRLGGGVFEAVVAQAAMIRGLGGEAIAIALNDRHAQEDRARFAASEVVLAEVRGPAQIGYAPDLARLLDECRLDCLHQHGIWMYPTRAAGDWALRSGKPYLISPHGMLDRWIVARGRWKKALARLGYERRSWQLARGFHALTQREASDIERESGRGDAIVIPNAGPPAQARRSPDGDPHLIYLGRIHPKKNLGALIAAWAAMTAAGELPSGARLTIAGWGEEADVAELARQLEAAPPSAAFIGAVFGEEKDRLLRAARFLVLPSLSEGLPMVVLEAWAAGTPVLLSSECNLPEGLAARAALDCGMNPVSIAAALRQALLLDPAEWRAMSAAGLALAEGPFSAATIASRWGSTYAALMAGARS